MNKLIARISSLVLALTLMAFSPIYAQSVLFDFAGNPTNPNIGTSYTTPPMNGITVTLSENNPEGYPGISPDIFQSTNGITTQSQMINDFLNIQLTGVLASNITDIKLGVSTMGSTLMTVWDIYNSSINQVGGDFATFYPTLQSVSILTAFNLTSSRNDSLHGIFLTQLEVDYNVTVPEPATMMVLGSTLFAALASKRARIANARV